MNLNWTWDPESHKQSKKGESPFQTHLNPKFILKHSHLRVLASYYGYERTFLVELPPGFWQRRDEVLPFGEAFLKGVRLYDYPGIQPSFWANTSNCFHSYTNYTWVTVPGYLDFVSRDGPSLWSKVQATSEMTRIAANGLFYCNSMNKNFYLYVMRQIILFRSWLNFTYSFLQNILS